MSRRLTVKQRAERVVEHWQSTAAITAALIEGFDDLVRLREIATPFFRERTEGETYKIRPSLSVRLAVAGDPPAKLSIAPGWNSVSKTVLTDHLEFEMTVTRVLEKPSTEIRASFSGGVVRPGLWSDRWGVESTARMLETIRHFLADPARAFANAEDNCCICGRVLTDPISRGRGVGPECLEKANMIREAVERYFTANAVSKEREEQILREAREQQAAAIARETERRRSLLEQYETARKTAKLPPDPQPSLF